MNFFIDNNDMDYPSFNSLDEAILASQKYGGEVLLRRGHTVEAQKQIMELHAEGREYPGYN